MFALKKFISFWLNPMPIIVVLLVAGAVLLWTKRWQKLGRWLVTLGIGVLLLFSNGAISRGLSLPLEYRYPPVPDVAAISPGLAAQFSQCRYISVLGGGGGDTPDFSANNKLSTASLNRLAEAVRLAQAFPNTKLIVSGAGGPGQNMSNAEMMKRAAVGLGIDSGRIIQFDSARDDIEEVDHIKLVVGAEPFIVVTSAMHLPRAIALMRRAGLNPLAVPADYRTRKGEPFRVENQLWGGGCLETSNSAHEYIGMVLAKVMGRM